MKEVSNGHTDILLFDMDVHLTDHAVDQRKDHVIKRYHKLAADDLVEREQRCYVEWEPLQDRVLQSMRCISSSQKPGTRQVANSEH